jgi:hypothetical protein
MDTIALDDAHAPTAFIPSAERAATPLPDSSPIVTCSIRPIPERSVGNSSARPVNPPFR